MLSGRRLDLLNPSPLDIEIEDIAHGLARLARWNGQTEGPYAFSVAQHSLLVEDLTAQLRPQVGPRERLTALLHDAPEFVIGDMISPFKAALGVDYRAFEDQLQAAVHIRFGLPPIPPDELAKTIKRADRLCAYFEAVQIAGFSVDEASVLFGAPTPPIAVTIAPEPAETAQAAFLARFETLLSAYEDEAPPRAGTGRRRR